MTQPIYVVIHPMGAGGYFLRAMIERMLRPDDEIPIWHSVHNNSLSAINKSGFDYNWTRSSGIGQTVDFFENLIISFPDPEPVVMGWRSLNWNAMLSRFPDAKVIILGFDEDDVPQLAINHFWKFFVDEYNGGAQAPFIDVRNSIPAIFTSAESVRPENLTDEEKSKLTKWLQSLVISQGGMVYTVPEQYQSQATIIKYKDIIGNKDKVISQLEEITGTTASDFIKGQYDQYLIREAAYMESIK